MEQNAVVKRIVSPGVVEISLMRQLECGLSCKSCEGCPQKPKEEITTLAYNSIGAAAGDIVLVQSNAGNAIGIAALVYIVPCLGLILGYLIANSVGLSELFCVLTAFVGIILGFIPAVMLNRAIVKCKKPEFTITAIRG